MLAAAGGIGWWAGTGSAARGLQVLISLLVVSCPCALGVALPLADDLAAGAMERLGVFIRRPVFWPRLLRVRHLLFDKTGTLTLESPRLHNPEILRSLDPDAVTALHTMIRGSLHPLCRSLTEAMAWQLPGTVTPARGTAPGASPPGTPGTLEEIPGCGLIFAETGGIPSGPGISVQPRRWTLGHPDWNGLTRVRHPASSSPPVSCSPGPGAGPGFSLPPPPSASGTPSARTPGKPSGGSGSRDSPSTSSAATAGKRLPVWRTRPAFPADARWAASAPGTKPPPCAASTSVTPSI